MKLYKVTVDNHTLYFIAEDRDHLMTLVASLLNTADYAEINRIAKIEQLAGSREPDQLNFYQGLV